jgi:hypothetical protein
MRLCLPRRCSHDRPAFDRGWMICERPARTGPSRTHPLPDWGGRLRLGKRFASMPGSGRKQ